MTILLTTPVPLRVNVPTLVDVTSVKFTGMSISLPADPIFGEPYTTVTWVWINKGVGEEPDEIVGQDEITLTAAQTKQLLGLSVNGKFGVETNRLLHLALKTLEIMPPGIVQDDE